MWRTASELGLIGSLRSYYIYGDEEDNVDKKLIYILPTNLGILLSHFALFIIVKVITKLNLGHRDKFEKEFQKISRRSSRSPDNADFAISRCCFAEDGKVMYN